MAGIGKLTAAQLAQAAYPGNPPPPGWSVYKTSATADGNNSVTAFINNTTNQVVAA